MDIATLQRTVHAHLDRMTCEFNAGKFDESFMTGLHVIINLQLAQIELAFSINTALGAIEMVSTDIPSAIAELSAAVANETTVDQSAVTLIKGIPALIAAAVAAAQAAGATAAQLAAFDLLATTINNNVAGLASSVSANTQPPTPAPAPSPSPAVSPAASAGGV